MLKSVWRQLASAVDFLVFPSVILSFWMFSLLGIHGVRKITSPNYHRSVPTITFVVGNDSSQDLRFDSRGYPESDGSGNGKYIFVPDGNGDLTKMYIDADIYVVPKDFSLAEKMIDEA